jgi:hypothetical protein
VNTGRRLHKVVSVFPTPEAAEAETRRQYRALSPNERVALTLDLQRRYYLDRGADRRLQRVLTVLERA